MMSRPILHRWHCWTVAYHSNMMGGWRTRSAVRSTHIKSTMDMPVGMKNEDSEPHFLDSKLIRTKFNESDRFDNLKRDIDETMQSAELQSMRADFIAHVKKCELENAMLTRRLQALERKENARLEREKERNFVIFGPSAPVFLWSIKKFLLTQLGIDDQIQDVRSLHKKDRIRATVVTMFSTIGKRRVMEASKRRLHGTDVVVTDDLHSDEWKTAEKIQRKLIDIAKHEEVREQKVKKHLYPRGLTVNTAEYVRNDEYEQFREITEN